MSAQSIVVRMTARTTAPYGSWPSPITAAEVAASSQPVGTARFTRQGILYTARMSEADGRTGLFLNPTGRLGEARRLLPAGFSVRSSVHEYGGGGFAVDGDTVVFVNADDQRLYRLELPAPHTGQHINTQAAPHAGQHTNTQAAQHPGPSAGALAEPTALTPETGGRVRYGDLTATGGQILAIEESHTDTGPTGAISRHVVRVDDTGATRLGGGAHFLAWPRLSPDGTTVACIGWDHPHMPWDETALILIDVATGQAERIWQREGMSILQPEWIGAHRLAVAADPAGIWNLYALDVPAFRAAARREPGFRPAEEELLLAADGEIGGPLWTLGQRHYLPAGGGRILALARFGTDRLIWAHPRTGEQQHLDPGLSTMSLQDRTADTVLLTGGSASRVHGLYLHHLATGETEPVALSAEVSHPAYYPRPEVRTFAGIHAIVYPPHHPELTGPEGERPPYVAFVHGGPTGQEVPAVSAHHAFFTSRGIGVINVNYRGSTGYGRAYRDALRGQWGVLDVTDTITAVRGLVDAGEADPARLAISGGSAGGWTVLRALTTTEVFAAGASYYGVGDLRALAEETHDFESRYLDGLIGPYPQEAQRYAALAPVNLLDDLRVPVAIFQGDEDPIVPPSQARLLIAALEARGLPYSATFYPGEAHGFVQPATRQDALEQELAFYGRVMGFTTPGLPAARMQGRGR